MSTRFVSFFHNNIKTSLKNSMFDMQKDKLTEVSIYANLKSYLKHRKIYINTYDISTKKPSFKNVHMDLPYPTLSNFHIWRKIFLERKKNILLCYEPPMINPFNYMRIIHPFFIKIYTCIDELVDDKKYFKFKFPKSSLEINTQAKKYKDKKFLILINRNISAFFPFKLLSPFGKELYSERIKAIEFFEQNIPEKFFLYGRGWNKPKKYNIKEKILGFKKYSTYKGEVEKKITLLANFKYCICFENLTDVGGYISEKIFDCFKARCVPIYWGASNIEKYIPQDCFIDFRDFLDYEKLLKHLYSIDESEYNGYIKNIENLLANKKFMSLWHEEGYAKFFLEDVLEIKQS